MVESSKKALSENLVPQQKKVRKFWSQASVLDKFWTNWSFKLERAGVAGQIRFHSMGLFRLFRLISSNSGLSSRSFSVLWLQLVHNKVLMKFMCRSKPIIKHEMNFVQTAGEYKKGQRLKVIEISIQLKVKPLALLPGQERVTPGASIGKQRHPKFRPSSQLQKLWPFFGRKILT